MFYILAKDTALREEALSLHSQAVYSFYCCLIAINQAYLYILPHAHHSLQAHSNMQATIFIANFYNLDYNNRDYKNFPEETDHHVYRQKSRTSVPEK